MTLRSGLQGQVEHMVSDADTAVFRQSGDVAVLATPEVVRLCEAAAVKALAGSLDEGMTSVGTRIALDHVAPTVTGRRVVATATLESVDGRRLELAVEARDEGGVVAKGTHTRVVVDRESFLRTASSR